MLRGQEYKNSECSHQEGSPNSPRAYGLGVFHSPYICRRIIDNSWKRWKGGYRILSPRNSNNILLYNSNIHSYYY